MDTVALAPTLLTLGVLLVLLAVSRPNTTAARIIPCTITFLLVIRMLHWRLTETLPDFSVSPAVLWAYLFMGLQLLSDASGLLFLIFVSRTVHRGSESDSNNEWLKQRLPTVDVFIATYNEEERILDRTILAATALDYNAKRIYVLDDGERDWLRELCDRRNVTYLARSIHDHAKAGNINYALDFTRRSGNASEFVLILDADFVVQPNFITRSLPLFHDDSVGCVQTPQHFFNADPLQHGFQTATSWPDEQRFFFDTLLPSKDAWGVAFSCGTSSIVRRAPIDSIGGFPTDSVTEDMLLSVILGTHGWKTVYLNERLSMGLAPEGLSEYLTQRGRWCLGLMQIVRSKWGPFGSAPTSLRQRVAIIDAALYWGGTFPFRLACMAGPIIYGLTGATVFEGNFDDVVLYIGPSLIAQLLLLAWISRGRCLPILSDASQLLTATTAMRATWVGLTSSRKQKFAVTAKGGNRDQTIIQWSLMRPFLILGALTFLSLLHYLVSGGALLADDSGLTIWLFWTYYNLVILLVTAITCIETPRDSSERFQTNEMVTAHIEGELTPLQLQELWPSGAVVRTSLPFGDGTSMPVEIDGVGTIASKIRRRTSKNVEIAFDVTPELSDRILLKLFSGRYQLAPDKTSFWDVIAAVTRRVFR